MNRRSAIWILLALLASALAVYLIGNDRVQLWDRDEPRYAQTSREMLQSGDWVVPRFLGEVRTAKPPLIYWAQASVMAVLGDNAFAARLPSALAMIAVLTLLALVIGRAAGRERGVWTAFIFGSTVLAILAAKMSVTDAVLLLWIVIGQLCLYALWRTGPRGWLILLLGISMGLGGLTKGPVAFGVHVTTLIALWLLNWRLEDLNPQGCRRLHWGLVFVGSVMVMSVVATPWLILIQQQEPTFLSHALGHDVVQRIQKGHEGHSGPPGYYVLAVWGTFFPWSLLIPAALV
ncbi:MAG TPA: phospholipid carrier-dependent glycosyltransferase, partial [Tepidisphaeraceae bacterium]